MYEYDEQAEQAVALHTGGDTRKPEQSAVTMMLRYMPFSPGMTRNQAPWVASGVMVHSPYRDIVAAAEDLLGPDGRGSAGALGANLDGDPLSHFNKELELAYQRRDSLRIDDLEDHTKALPIIHAHRVREYELRRLRQFHPLSEQDSRLEAAYEVVVGAIAEVEAAAGHLARFAAFQAGDKRAYANPIPEPVAIPATADVPARSFADLVSTLDSLAGAAVPAGAEGVPVLRDQLATIGEKLNAAMVSIEPVLPPAVSPLAAQRVAGLALGAATDPADRDRTPDSGPARSPRTGNGSAADQDGAAVNPRRRT